MGTVSPLAAHASPGRSAPSHDDVSAGGGAGDDIVRAGALWGFRPLVRSFGGDPNALLLKAGLSASEIDDHDNYIPRPAVHALLETSARSLDCSDFGLRLAATQDTYILGALAFAIRNASDLRSACRVAARRLHFHAPNATLTLEGNGESERVRLVVQGGLERPMSARQSHEQAIGLTSRIMCLLTRGAVWPVGVQFRHSPASSPETYETRLRVIPEFEADVDAVIVRAQDLDAPLANPDRQLQAVVERFLEANSPLAGQRTDRQVRHVLSRLMRLGSATMADVAACLNVHPRTLQRRLAALGTTYEQVRDDVRRELAEVYLAHDVIPIAHVAHLLGYADQSVLTRSCLRWFGKTPMAIRREHAPEAGSTRARPEGPDRRALGPMS